MPNYVVAVEVVGSFPTASEIEEHIAKKSTWCSRRILETVWLVGTFDIDLMVWEHFSAILGSADRLFVAEGKGGYSANLLVDPDDQFKQTWAQYEKSGQDNSAAYGANFSRPPPPLNTSNAGGLK